MAYSIAMLPCGGCSSSAELAWFDLQHHRSDENQRGRSRRVSAHVLAKRDDREHDRERSLEVQQKRSSERAHPL